MLKIRNLTKTYGNTIVLNNLNLDINSGEMIAIMGKSGSGKSTLLNSISGLTSIQDGKIYYHSKLLPTSNRNKMAEFREKEIGFIEPLGLNLCIQ